MIFWQAMKHILLGSGILVFMNGLIHQHTVDSIHFMAFIQGPKTILIMKSMVF